MRARLSGVACSLYRPELGPSRCAERSADYAGSIMDGYNALDPSSPVGSRRSSLACLKSLKRTQTAIHTAGSWRYATAHHTPPPTLPGCSITTPRCAATYCSRHPGIPALPLSHTSPPTHKAHPPKARAYPLSRSTPHALPASSPYSIGSSSPRAMPHISREPF